MSVRVCFVCLGNICRSPTAEGVFQSQLDAAGLGDAVFADSAGTAATHVGEAADPRSRAEARSRGVALHSTSRQFQPGDFRRFDFVLAMDATNLRHLQAMPGAEAFGGTLALFRSFDPTAPPGASVPDPYYGGDRGFAEVYDQCVRAGEGLLRHLQASRRV